MQTDTIVAIATALGESGVGVVRISGPDAVVIAAKLARTEPPLSQAPTHTVHHAWLRNDGVLLDEVLVTVLRGPRTFTGEDVVEIGVHGGTVPSRRVLRAVLAAGGRLAERGEFTKRAFLNGRIDLSQAEAVADVIASRTERSADAALTRLRGKLAARTCEVEGKLLDLLARLEANLDFNEDVRALGREEVGRTLRDCQSELEELRRRAPWGRRLREGATVVLVGRPNVGKSSLFNSILQEERALVHETPGTTRDYLEAWLDFEGVPVRLVDTAGMRSTHAAIEAEGVARAWRMEREADLRLVVFDLSAPWSPEDEDVLRATEATPRLLVWNKSDLVQADAPPPKEMNGNGQRVVGARVSARTARGVPKLCAAVAERLLEGVGREPGEEVLPNERHEDAIRRACESLALAQDSWGRGWSEELIAADVRDGAVALGEITGRTVGEEVLDRIFSKFCVGK